MNNTTLIQKMKTASKEGLPVKTLNPIQKSAFEDVIYPDRDAAERARFELQFAEPDRYRYKVLPAKGGYKIAITAQPGTLHPNQEVATPIGYVQKEARND